MKNLLNQAIDLLDRIDSDLLDQESRTLFDACMCQLRIVYKNVNAPRSPREKAQFAKKEAESAAKRGDERAARNARAREAYYRSHEKRKAYQREYVRNRKGKQDNFADMFRKASTKDELKKIYLRLVRIHHPDAGGSHQTMVQINAAYNLYKKNFHP